MPHIVMKRDDIPNGTLQVLDLQPNVSQRNLVLDPPGQNKYVNAPLNETVVLTGLGPIVSYTTSRGLAAWFVTNVNDGTGAFATGTVTIAAGNAAPADTVTIDASAMGGPAVTFTFVLVAALTTDVVVGVDEDTSASNLAAAINLAANGLNPYVSAAAPGGGPPSPVNLTAVQIGTASNGITLAEVGANITVSGPNMAGGVDANALTASNANTIATNILTDLVRFGDLTLPALAMTLVAVNAIVAAEVATATITADQLGEILDILSNRLYILPKGVQVDLDGSTFQILPAVGSPGGPGFVDPSHRHTYNTGSLAISFGEGHLHGFVDPAFTYRGVGGARGEAVVVYNDDGSLYTV